jgi:hypothetical protein
MPSGLEALIVKPSETTPANNIPLRKEGKLTKSSEKPSSSLLKQLNTDILNTESVLDRDFKITKPDEKPEFKCEWKVECIYRMHCENPTWLVDEEMLTDIYDSLRMREVTDIFTVVINSEIKTKKSTRSR